MEEEDKIGSVEIKIADLLETELFDSEKEKVEIQKKILEKMTIPKPLLQNEIFTEINFFDVKSTICHSQLRDSIKCFDKDHLFFVSYNKISSLNYKNGELKENIIQEEHNQNLRISNYRKTKSYFLWYHRNHKTLYCLHLKSGKLFTCDFHRGYECNTSDVTVDEKLVFCGGQTSDLSVYSLDEVEGLISIQEATQDQGSYANDVKLSPDNLFLGSVTDRTTFHIYEVDPSQVTKDRSKILTRIYGSSARSIDGKKKFRGLGDMCSWSSDSTRLGVAHSYCLIIYNVKKRIVEFTFRTEDCSIVKFSPVRPDVLVYAKNQYGGEACILRLMIQQDEGIDKNGEEILYEDNIDPSVLQGFRESIVDDKEELLKKREKRKKEEEESFGIRSITEQAKKMFVAKGTEEKFKEDLTHGFLNTTLEKWKVQSMCFSEDGDRVFVTYYNYGYHGSRENSNLLLCGSLGHEYRGLRTWQGDKMHAMDFKERKVFLFTERDLFFEDPRTNEVRVKLKECLIEGIPLVLLGME